MNMCRQPCEKNETKSYHVKRSTYNQTFAFLYKTDDTVKNILTYSMPTQ